MDIVPPPVNLLNELQNEGLAELWVFDNHSGYRLKPRSADEIALLLKWAQNNNQPVALSQVDASLMENPLWMDLNQLKQVRHYWPEDFAVQAETGLTFGELNTLLKPHGQTFPLNYPANMILGEVLAEDRPALETGLQGYCRDYVLKTEIAMPDGAITISGADVVKNVTGYDLAKLYVGGQNSFGVLTSVTLKLAPAPKNRQYWLYTLDSHHLACSLAEILLASSLPLSACELYKPSRKHGDPQWHLFIEVSGENWAMIEAKEQLQRFHHFPAPQVLDTQTGELWRNQLMSWPTDETVMEAALPLSDWIAFSAMISQQSSINNLRLQLRPAAGLIYISGPLFPFAALRYLKGEVQQAQGFMQILQLSRMDAALFSEATVVFAEFNLPENPILHHLLKTLKNGYDPQGILFTPRLPIAINRTEPL